MAKPQYRKDWRKVRAYVLARDHFRCQVQLAGICTGDATEVDHERAIALWGVSYDTDHLRASCRPCNRHLGGQVAELKRKIGQAAVAVGPSRDW